MIKWISEIFRALKWLLYHFHSSFICRKPHWNLVFDVWCVWPLTFVHETLNSCEDIIFVWSRWDVFHILFRTRFYRSGNLPYKSHCRQCFMPTQTFTLHHASNSDNITNLTQWQVVLGGQAVFLIEAYSFIWSERLLDTWKSDSKCNYLQVYLFIYYLPMSTDFT